MAEAELASYEKARAAYRSNYTKIARLGKAVPADDDVRSLMVQLNSAADGSKVDFRTINLDGSAGAAPAAGAGGTAAAGPRAPSRRRRAARASAAPASRRCPSPSSSRAASSTSAAFFNRLDRFVKVKNQGLDVTGPAAAAEQHLAAPGPAEGLPAHHRRGEGELLPAAARPRTCSRQRPLTGPTAAAAAGADPRRPQRLRPRPPRPQPSLEPPDERYHRHLALPQRSAGCGRWRSS